jgi:hypothetical protein
MGPTVQPDDEARVVVKVIEVTDPATGLERHLASRTVASMRVRGGRSVGCRAWSIEPACRTAPRMGLVRWLLGTVTCIREPGSLTSPQSSAAVRKLSAADIPAAHACRREITPAWARSISCIALDAAMTMPTTVAAGRRGCSMRRLPVDNDVRAAFIHNQHLAFSASAPRRLAFSPLVAEKARRASGEVAWAAAAPRHAPGPPDMAAAGVVISVKCPCVRARPEWNTNVGRVGHLATGEVTAGGRRASRS